MKSDIVDALRQELQKAADPVRAKSMQRFFKENQNYLGVSNKAYDKILKTFVPRVKLMNKKDVWAICEELRKSGVMEESGIASVFARAQADNYTEDDIDVFERWINLYIRDWASCDVFCGHCVGALIVKYPDTLHRLTDWAKSDLPYTRRAAAVSFTDIIKDGDYLEDVFSIADILLLDKEDIVQKGYGWMLKIAADKYPQEVFEYVCKHKKTMPRTALRYAIEKLPGEMKKTAMSRND